MDKPRQLCPDTQVFTGLAELSKQTQLDKQSNPVGTFYSLNVAVSASDVPVEQKARLDCLDGMFTRNVMSVYVPSSTNLPALQTLNIEALNVGLAFTGSQMRINEQEAVQATACYKDNLARLMVEFGSRCKANDDSNRCASFGSDIFDPNVERVSLSGLDTIAATIQHGIASCKRPGGKGR